MGTRAASFAFPFLSASNISAGDFLAALLGLAVMTMFAKRGSAVLEAPEESLAPEREWTVPEPAPPGTLHPGLDPAGSNVSYRDPEPDRSRGRRQRGPYQLRVGVPGSTAGRVALGVSALFVVGLLTAGVLAARYSILHDGRFVVSAPEDIEVEGNHHLSRDGVVDVFGSDLQHNVFHSPLDIRQADLQRLPWVERATVMRLLPNRLRVNIVERTPVAFVRQGSRVGLVDASGVLLDMPQDIAGDQNSSFPVLTGISQDDPLSVRAGRMAIYQRFMQALDSGGVKRTQAISEVDISNPEDLKALVADGGNDILVHFGDENFLERYKLFQEHLPTWKQLYPKLAAVDSRYENQMVLEMAQGTAAPLQGKDGPSNEELKGNIHPPAEPAKHAKEKAAAKPAAHAKSKPVKR